MSGFTYPGPTKLKDITKLPLLERETPENIRGIWLKYHNEDVRADGKRPTFGDTFQKDQYSLLKLRAQQCPMFVLPVVRPKGYITMVTQWQDRFCLITSLEEFQKRRSFSFPHVAVQFFTELMDSKSLVLSRTELFSPDLNREEGILLYNNLMRFYLQDREFRKFVEPFNKRPNEFDFNALLKEVSLTAV
jgi:hypothetical protein